VQPVEDYTFAFLATAVAAAGGRVHITASDLIRMTNGFMLEMDSDGKGGTFLTLVERKPLSPIIKRILQGEPIDGN